MAGSFAALLLFAALVDDVLLERHLFGRTVVWCAILPQLSAAAAAAPPAPVAVLLFPGTVPGLCMRALEASMSTAPQQAARSLQGHGHQYEHLMHLAARERAARKRLLLLAPVAPRAAGPAGARRRARAGEAGGARCWAWCWR